MFPEQGARAGFVLKNLMVETGIITMEPFINLVVMSLIGLAAIVVGIGLRRS